MRPEEVCIWVTKSFMFSSACAEGRMTMSTPLVQGPQFEVGDDRGDLDEFVARLVEAGHFAVDPHNSVVAHPASLYVALTREPCGGVVDDTR